MLAVVAVAALTGLAFMFGKGARGRVGTTDGSATTGYYPAVNAAINAGAAGGAAAATRTAVQSVAEQVRTHATLLFGVRWRTPPGARFCAGCGRLL